MIQSQCWPQRTLMMVSVLLFGVFPTKVASFVVHHHHHHHHQRQRNHQRPRQHWLSTNNKHDESSHSPNNNNNNNIQKYNISLLLIDHYDSFTYNLYDYLAQWTVDPPTVIAKDAFDSWTAANDWNNNWDGIILSPGPGSPEEQPPLSHQVISQNPNLPILGVCLGHQLLALEYGATVDTAPIPIHGQDHWICCSCLEEEEDGDEDGDEDHKSNLLFQDLPNNFRVVRYHSLAAKNTNFPDCLQVTARSKDDNVIQGIQHTRNPHYGVQFHPESIGTQHGMALLENFCKIVQQNKLQKEEQESKFNLKLKPEQVNQQHDEEEHQVQRVTIPNTIDEPSIVLAEEKDAAIVKHPPNNKFRVLLHAFDANNVSPQEVFEEFYANQESHAIWLDSSSRGTIDILAAPTLANDILEYHSSDGDNDDILTDRKSVV